MSMCMLLAFLISRWQFFFIIRYFEWNLKLSTRMTSAMKNMYKRYCHGTRVRISRSHGLPRIFRRTTDFPRQKREVRERNGSVFHARER